MVVDDRAAEVKHKWNNILSEKAIDIKWRLVRTLNDHDESKEGPHCLVFTYLPACQEVPVLGSSLTHPRVAFNRFESL